MSGGRMTGIRQHLRITLDGADTEVWTKPYDYDLYGLTAKKHGWATAQENPVGYLLFLAWSAARRAGAIEATLPYERFKEQVDDLAELGDDPVDPTPPAPGAG
jgi:hypothetical protein